MASLEQEIFGGDAQEDVLPEEFKTMNADDINRRCGLGEAGRGRRGCPAQPA